MPDFVVHEHRAEKAGLHHDLRLETGGVLRSWAGPKGMPATFGPRRLAIEVAPHALSYIDFQGTIEKGYGKGEVAIWDEGEYQPISVTDKTWFIQFKGDRLRGNYYLRHWEGKKWLIWKQGV